MQARDEAPPSVDSHIDFIDERSSRFRVVGGAALDRLYAIGRPLLTSAGAGARLYACFSEAKQFLDTITVAELLPCIVADRERRRTLEASALRVDHVGLLLPEEVEGELGWAASRAGFTTGHVKFSSVVVARELGELQASAAIPTTVFMAYGEGPDGRLTGIEGFLPHGVEDDVVDRWVSEGVAVHLAIKTDSAAALGTAREVFEAEGFAMPAFMNGKPMTNPADDITVLYFDRIEGGRRLRVEFCWSPDPIW